MLNLRLLIIDNILSCYVLQWTKQQKCHGDCWGTDWCDSGCLLYCYLLHCILPVHSVQVSSPLVLRHRHCICVENRPAVSAINRCGAGVVQVWCGSSPVTTGNVHHAVLKQ